MHSLRPSNCITNIDAISHWNRSRSDHRRQSTSTNGERWPHRKHPYARSRAAINIFAICCASFWLVRKLLRPRSHFSAFFILENYHNFSHATAANDFWSTTYSQHSIVHVCRNQHWRHILTKSCENPTDYITRYTRLFGYRHQTNSTHY